MTTQLPAPEWCKPGAPAYILGRLGSVTGVTVAKITPTQVVARIGSSVEYRFSLKQNLSEIGGDPWNTRRLVGPDHPKAILALAELRRKKAAHAAERLVGEWVRTGDPDALRHAIRTLTEAAEESA